MRIEGGAVEAALKWRAGLLIDTGAARAASARLRRAASGLDVLLVEETHDLLRAVRLPARKPGDDLDRRLLVLAMTLPRLEKQGTVSLAAALGQTGAGRTPTGDERPRLSPARFGALVRAARARDWDAFGRVLRRALAILGDTPIDVVGFTRDLVGFGDATLRRWTYEYWQTLAPQTDAPIDPEDREAAP